MLMLPEVMEPSTEPSIDAFEPIIEHSIVIPKSSGVWLLILCGRKCAQIPNNLQVATWVFQGAE